jgi:hypothetical protein
MTLVYSTGITYEDCQMSIVKCLCYRPQGDELNQGRLTEGRRLSTVNLLVLTSLDPLIFILKMSFTFIQNKLA